MKITSLAPIPSTRSSNVHFGLRTDFHPVYVCTYPGGQFDESSRALEAFFRTLQTDGDFLKIKPQVSDDFCLSVFRIGDTSNPTDRFVIFVHQRNQPNTPGSGSKVVAKTDSFTPDKVSNGEAAKMIKAVIGLLKPYKAKK